MASFTDSVIPQFNPYIQQLPVEAMVSVGMDKQRRYEAGYQRIQSQIDQVAGMDIYKPADRQYMQSKLNELGNNLKGVAAADFSNFQLVNSVGGMVGQLSKDSNIRNAVSSTAKIKKEQAFIEEQRKEGKLHANNENYFNEELQSYVNNDKVGEVFSSKYQPYSDYKKKWIDVQKSLGVKETQTDLPFVMQDGKIVLDKNGKPIANDYMIRETFKGVDPQRLKDAVMTTLDDNDYKQMQIDAHFSYKGYTPDMLIQDATEKYTVDRTQLETGIKNLNILKNQYAGNNEMTQKIDNQISAYTKRITEQDDQFRSTVEGINKNPEGYKVKLFTMNSINTFANTFSNMSHIQNVVASPIKQQMNEDRNYNFKVIEFDTKNKQWQKNYDLEVTKENRAANKEGFDQKIKLYELGLGPNPFGGAGAPKYPGAPPTDEDVLNGMKQSFIEGAKLDNLNSEKNRLKVDWAKNQPTKEDTEKQLGKKMTDKEYVTFLDEQFNNNLTAYNKDRNSVDASTRQMMDNYVELDKLYKLKVNVLDNAMNQANKLNPDAVNQIDKLPTNKVDFVKKTFENGNAGAAIVTTKSARDIFEDIQSGKAKLTVERGTEGDADDFILSYPSQKLEYRVPKQSGWFGMDAPGAKMTRPVLQSVYDALQVSPSIQKRDKDYARILGENINSLAPMASNLPKNAMTSLLPMIEEKFGREQKGETEQVTGFVKGKDFDIDAVRKLVLDANAKPIYTMWGNDVFITVSGKTGENNGEVTTQKFKISRNDFNRTFPALAETTDIDFLQSAAANGSTNYKFRIAKTALNNKDEAFNTANYSIGSGKYIVKGDIFFDQNDKNNSLPVIWVKSKKTGNVISIPSKNYMLFKGAQESIGQINDLTIDNYLKNNNLDADF